MCPNQSCYEKVEAGWVHVATATIRRSLVAAVSRVKPARVPDSVLRLAGLVDRCMRKMETSCLWMVKRSRAAGWPFEVAEICALEGGIGRQGRGIRDVEAERGDVP